MYMYMYDILIRLLTPLSAASSPSCAQLARDVPGVAIEPLAWALAFGACFGGNGTLIGARFARPFYPPTHPPTHLPICCCLTLTARATPNVRKRGSAAWIGVVCHGFLLKVRVCGRVRWCVRECVYDCVRACAGVMCAGVCGPVRACAGAAPTS
jgi:hypothetical protein